MPGILPDSPAVIFREMLIALGLGEDSQQESPTWPVYATKLPDSPDNVISVFDATAISQGKEMVGGQMQQREATQVMVRSSNHAPGHTKVNEIAITLDENVYQETVVVGGNTYLVHAVTRESGPIELGDSPETRRELFSLNLSAVITQVT